MARRQAKLAESSPPPQLRWVDPASLKRSPNNARVHNEKQLEALQRSMRAFGFVTPIIVDEEDCILAGHGRAEAAQREGTSVLVMTAPKMTKAQRRAFMLADNKTALLALWDEDRLRQELEAISDLVDATGFSQAEIDHLLKGWEETGDPVGLDIPPEDEKMGEGAKSAELVATIKINKADQEQVCALLDDHEIVYDIQA